MHNRTFFSEQCMCEHPVTEINSHLSALYLYDISFEIDYSTCTCMTTRMYTHKLIESLAVQR